MFEEMKGYKIPMKPLPRPSRVRSLEQIHGARKVRYIISLICWIPGKICYYLSNRIFNRLTSQIWIETGKWW